MYENDLLNAEAIAGVAAGVEGFGPVDPDTVRDWLGRRRWDAELFRPGGVPEERTEDA
jgi:hypothetical protein